MISKRLLFLLALFLCCAAPTAAGFMIGGGPHHKGPPGTCCQAVKDQSRVSTEPLPVRVVPVTKYRLDPPVQKADVNAKPENTLPWSCETIRAATARLKPEQISRLARVYRLNEQQIAEARRCLKEKT